MESGGTNSMLMTMVLDWAHMGVMVMCANTFVHVVFKNSLHVEENMYLFVHLFIFSK